MFAAFKRLLTARRIGSRYPLDPGRVPVSFRGMPELIAERCRGDGACAAACPSAALRFERHGGGWSWELDRACCVACGLCAEACPSQAVAISGEFELATHTRAGLRTRVELPASAQEVSR